MTKIKVAAVQAEPVWMDLSATLDKTEKLVAEAAQAGAQLIAFPELWLPGFPIFLSTTVPAQAIPYVIRYRKASMRMDSPEMERLRAIAAKHGIVLGTGLSERDANTLYMSQVLLGSDGEILLHRRKLKPTHTERTLFGQGDGSDLVVAETPLGRIGALNCAEHLQSLTKFAMAAQDEQIHISCWPPLDCIGSRLLRGDATVAINRTYAAETGTFVLMSTQIVSKHAIEVFTSEPATTMPDVSGGGYARIFAPDTSELTEPLPRDVEGIVYAEIDLDSIEIAKNILDPVGHYARPDIFTVHIDRTRRPAFTERVHPRPEDEPSANATKALA